MNRDKLILIAIFVSIILFNFYAVLKNPNCPFHVDYGTYIDSINNFYETRVVESNVNGKYMYVYMMAILLTPFKYFGLNLYNGLTLITGAFQVLLVYLFYKYTGSIIKTALAATTLTFLTFMGHAETVIIASVFLMLYFIYRDTPYSEFFITIASFIRLDFAVYYLFARKKTAIIPIIITFLQWFSRKYFIHSDFGINQAPLYAGFDAVISFGVYIFIFIYFSRPVKQKLDLLSYASIIVFMIFFLKFPSQKVFFFPVLLSFMFFDFRFKNKIKSIKYVIIPLVIINLIFAAYIQINRTNNCTSYAVYEYSKDHTNSVFYGVFQPYIDYYNKTSHGNYTHQMTRNCLNETDYFIAEDWRNSQILYLPYKFCLEEWNGKYN